MKENNKQELSYFRLKLRSYMSEHHPERLQDTEFITARADMALTAYCDAVAQGFTHPEAESMANEVLYYGLHFSKYDTLVSVLENEFERELPAPLPEKLVPIPVSYTHLDVYKRQIPDINKSKEVRDKVTGETKTIKVRDGHAIQMSNEMCIRDSHNGGYV